MTRPDSYAIGREDTTRQGDFAGGPKLENNKSNMADSRHLGNIQVGVTQPLLVRFAPKVCVLYWSYEGYTEGWGQNRLH